MLRTYVVNSGVIYNFYSKYKIVTTIYNKLLKQ